jgi:hypothetical protein
MRFLESDARFGGRKRISLVARRLVVGRLGRGGKDSNLRRWNQNQPGASTTDFLTKR